MYDLTKDYPVVTAALAESISEKFGELDEYGLETEPQTISATSYDGFIAHTNGGFRTLIPCTLRDAESRGLTDVERDVLQSYIDQSNRDAAEAYIADSELAEHWEAYENDSCADKYADEWLYDRWHALESEYNAFNAVQASLFRVPTWSDSLAGHQCEAQREAFYEVLDRWLAEGGTFFYELTAIYYEKDHRRNVTGADEIYFFVGVNTDFEYGRERGLVTQRETTIKLSRLTPLRVAQVVEALTGILS